MDPSLEGSQALTPGGSLALGVAELLESFMHQGHRTHRRTSSNGSSSSFRLHRRQGSNGSACNGSPVKRMSTSHSASSFQKSHSHRSSLNTTPVRRGSSSGVISYSNLDVTDSDNDYNECESETQTSTVDPVTSTSANESTVSHPTHNESTRSRNGGNQPQLNSLEFYSTESSVDARGSDGGHDGDMDWSGSEDEVLQGQSSGLEPNDSNEDLLVSPHPDSDIVSSSSSPELLASTSTTDLITPPPQLPHKTAQQRSNDRAWSPEVVTFQPGKRRSSLEGVFSAASRRKFSRENSPLAISAASSSPVARLISQYDSNPPSSSCSTATLTEDHQPAPVATAPEIPFHIRRSVKAYGNYSPKLDGVLGTQTSRLLLSYCISRSHGTVVCTTTCKERNYCRPRDPASWTNMAATPDDCERTATVALPTAASGGSISGDLGTSAALDAFSTVYEFPLTRF